MYIVGITFSSLYDCVLLYCYDIITLLTFQSVIMCSQVWWEKLATTAKSLNIFCIINYNDFCLISYDKFAYLKIKHLLIVSRESCYKHTGITPGHYYSVILGFEFWYVTLWHLFCICIKCHWDIKDMCGIFVNIYMEIFIMTGE